MGYLKGPGIANVQRLRARFSWQLVPCLEVGLHGTKVDKHASRAPLHH